MSPMMSLLTPSEQKQIDNLWNCAYCGQHFVVPSLARDHERDKCYCAPIAPVELVDERELETASAA